MSKLDSHDDSAGALTALQQPNGPKSSRSYGSKEFTAGAWDVWQDDATRQGGSSATDTNVIVSAPAADTVFTGVGAFGRPGRRPGELASTSSFDRDLLESAADSMRRTLRTKSGGSKQSTTAVSKQSKMRKKKHTQRHHADKHNNTAYTTTADVYAQKDATSAPETPSAGVARRRGRALKDINATANAENSVEVAALAAVTEAAARAARASSRLYQEGNKRPPRQDSLLPSPRKKKKKTTKAKTKSRVIKDTHTEKKGMVATTSVFECEDYGSLSSSTTSANADASVINRQPQRATVPIIEQSDILYDGDDLLLSQLVSPSSSPPEDDHYPNNICEVEKEEEEEEEGEGEKENQVQQMRQMGAKKEEEEEEEVESAMSALPPTVVRRSIGKNIGAKHAYRAIATQTTAISRFSTITTTMATTAASAAAVAAAATRESKIHMIEGVRGQDRSVSFKRTPLTRHIPREGLQQSTRAYRERRAIASQLRRQRQVDNYEKQQQQRQKRRRQHMTPASAASAVLRNTNALNSRSPANPSITSGTPAVTFAVPYSPTAVSAAASSPETAAPGFYATWGRHKLISPGTPDDIVVSIQASPSCIIPVAVRGLGGDQRNTTGRIDKNERSQQQGRSGATAKKKRSAK